MSSSRIRITWPAGTTRHDACRDAVNASVTARGGRTPISLASCCGVAPAAWYRGQGKIELGLDLVSGTHVDRAHRDQRLRDQRQPAGMFPAPGTGRGRAAQFGLGQQPQVGFRASAVHVLSVPPVARSSSKAAGLDGTTASTTQEGKHRAVPGQRR
jgi:hypothetical protein